MKKILILLLLLSIAVPTTTAQEETTPTATRLQVFGRGTPQTIQWHPTEDILLVSTVTGAWLYGDHLREIAHLDNARLATFNPQGTLIAGVDQNNRITLWDSENYEKVGSFDNLGVHVSALSWSHDGSRLASADVEGEFAIWNVDEREQELSNDNFNGADQLLWSPDNQYVATVAADQTMTINLVDGSIKRQEGSKCCGSEFVDPDDRYDIAWLDNHRIARVEVGWYEYAIWDVASNVISMTDEPAFLPPLSLRMYYGGLVSISTSGEQMAFSRWALPTAPIYLAPTSETGNFINVTSPVTLEGHYQYATAIEWNASDTRIASVGYLGDIRLWDVETRTLIAESDEYAQTTPYHPYWFWYNPANPEIGGLPMWNYDGQLLAVPDNLHSVTIWNIETGELTATLSDHDERVIFVRWNPVNNLLVTSTSQIDSSRDDPMTRIWNGDTGELIDEFESITPAIAWHPDGTILISSIERGTLSVWNSATHTLADPIGLQNYTDTNMDIVIPNGFWWSADGDKLNVDHEGSIGRTVTTVEYPSLTPLSSFENHGHTSLYSVGALSPDGYWSRVAQYCRKGSTYGCDDPFVIETATYDLGIPFDSKTGFSTLRGHRDYIDGIAWSPDTQFLASYSADGEGRIWDVVEATTEFITHPTDQLIWSPDGCLIASHNTWQNQWEIYSVPDGQLRYTIPEFSRNESFIVWSPDSQRIAQVHDGIVEVWELD